MNVVDSSGWLAYFADDANAGFFAPAIENAVELVVPAISIYEVFKRVLQVRGENEALQIVAVMSQGTVVELDLTIALDAAKLSVALNLPMADGIILSTAYAYKATLWTQDAHFEGLAGVQYIAAR